MDEIWKDVVGYEGYYQVSNLGRIKRTRGGKGAQSGKILKQYMRDGYSSVYLTKDAKTEGYSVHRLVAMAFHENPENKICVNHINGVKSDNRAVNLEWVTYKENTAHAWKTGLCTVKPLSDETRKKMSESRRGKHLSEEHIRSIKEAHKRENLSDETLRKRSESIKRAWLNDDTRRKHSESIKGRVWVNNGAENFMVRPENLQNYLNRGYVQGIHK